MKHTPFGDLRKQLGLPDPPEPSEPAVSPTPATAATPGVRDFRPGDFDRSGPARAVVRYERSGRGGKEVTVIEQLGLKEIELQTWLKELKAALGCGGSLDGDTIMLQGDHRKRLPALLTQRRVRKITVG